MRKLTQLGLSLAVCLTMEVALVVVAKSPAAPSGSGSNQAYGSAEIGPEHGRQVAEANCAACHGSEGNSADPQYPNLAGQNPAYLYWQLLAFKSGARKSDIMSGVALTLSEGDMADAASYYSQQLAQPDPVKDSRLAAYGKRIFYEGGGTGTVPACVMCHSSPGQKGMPMMMGMMANAPYLNGQHAEYIFDQLNRFASGERQAMMMGRIAAALSATDKIAVAVYLSSIP